MKKILVVSVYSALVITMAVTLTSCYERRNFHTHREHSPYYFDRHRVNKYR